jgi:hypothetical protein
VLTGEEGRTGRFARGVGGGGGAGASQTVAGKTAPHVGAGYY